MLTMKLSFFSFVVLRLVSAKTSCGPEGTLTIAGSASVKILAEKWKERYQDSCPNSSILIHDGGSSAGAARVCGTRAQTTPVDIGGMTRDWNKVEAVAENGWLYDCERSQRKAIQIEVGFEGIAFMTSNEGVAADCIQKLGGLTNEQLRWMYSNYDLETLVEEEWDLTSVSSNASATRRLWSDLHHECEPVDIAISGARADSAGADRFFQDFLFVGDDETFDFARQQSLWTAKLIDRTAFVANNDAAITFVGLSQILSPDIKTEVAVLSTVEIQGRDGEFYSPGDAAFGDLAYPLSRRLYMNLFDDEESLAKTRPFLEFGLSDEGTEILKEAGFWTLRGWERIVMKTRAQTESGIPSDDFKGYCPPPNSDFAVAGSSTVFPVAQIWSEVYAVFCDASFTIEGGGSSVGAGRVCANLDMGEPVEIGNMSREWKLDTEAAAGDGEYLYQCIAGDSARSAIQISVAFDGMVVSTKKDGAAARCIGILGGLTSDQLRWMYSGYTDTELEATGWDPSSLTNSDRDSGTHLWSELDSRCESVEIRIGHPGRASGTRDFFDEVVLSNRKEGETVASERPSGSLETEIDEELVAYLNEYGEAIAYFGYAYFQEYSAYLFATPIRNSDGDFVLPTRQTVGNGSYNPLARSIFMNVLNEESVIRKVTPFLEFAYNHEDLVAATGYIGLSPEKASEMVHRVKSAQMEEDAGVNNGVIIGVSIGAFVVGLILFVSVYLRLRGEKS